MKKLPIVALVGRTNVGKSSLFNRILGKREAIVADEPGTTRDSVQRKIEVNSKSFWLVDTAGVKTAEDDFELTIQEQIDEAIELATIILVLVEADVPVTDEDRRLAKKALKSKKPVVLVVNKMDKAKKADLDAFKKLGIKQTYYISATHDRAVDELVKALTDDFPKISEKSSGKELNISLIGRPNVGKSHLFNSLIKKQGAIVADVAGTTRDVNKKTIKFHEREVNILDTAGVRRPGKIQRGVEKFSVLRTLHAIEESDICLLLMDVNELNSHLDLKLAGTIKDAGKGLILVISKWDSIDADPFLRDHLAKKISENFHHVPWAPLIITSSITGQNVTKILELATEIDERRHLEIKTSQLNAWLSKVKAHHPPAGLKNSYPKLNYMTQSDVTPPAFKIFGSDTKLLHWSYKRYMERELRRDYDLDGTPVNFYFYDKDHEKE